MRTLLVLLAAACLAPLPARAEKVDTPPAALRKAATDVFVGTVKAVYTRTSREGHYRVERHVAEVEVVRTEKGALAKGALAYVRYWQRSWIAASAPPPGTSGHRGLPKEGETLRIHAVRAGYNGFGKTTDGGLDVFGANGFQRLPAKAAGKQPAQPPK